MPPAPRENQIVARGITGVIGSIWIFADAAGDGMAILVEYVSLDQCIGAVAYVTVSRAVTVVMQEVIVDVHRTHLRIEQAAPFRLLHTIFYPDGGAAPIVY